jgi:hypothetical protein
LTCTDRYHPVRIICASPSASRHRFGRSCSSAS